MVIVVCALLMVCCLNLDKSCSLPVAQFLNISRGNDGAYYFSKMLSDIGLKSNKHLANMTS